MPEYIEIKSTPEFMKKMLGTTFTEITGDPLILNQALLDRIPQAMVTALKNVVFKLNEIEIKKPKKVEDIYKQISIVGKKEGWSEEDSKAVTAFVCVKYLMHLSWFLSLRKQPLQSLITVTAKREGENLAVEFGLKEKNIGGYTETDINLKQRSLSKTLYKVKCSVIINRDGTFTYKNENTENIFIHPTFLNVTLLPIAESYLTTHPILTENDLYVLVPFLINEKLLGSFNTVLLASSDAIKEKAAELISLYFVGNERQKKLDTLTNLKSAAPASSGLPRVDETDEDEEVLGTAASSSPTTVHIHQQALTPVTEEELKDEPNQPPSASVATLPTASTFADPEFKLTAEEEHHDPDSVNSAVIKEIAAAQGWPLDTTPQPRTTPTVSSTTPPFTEDDLRLAQEKEDSVGALGVTFSEQADQPQTQSGLTQPDEKEESDDDLIPVTDTSSVELAAKLEIDQQALSEDTLQATSTIVPSPSPVTPTPIADDTELPDEKAETHPDSAETDLQQQGETGDDSSRVTSRQEEPTILINASLDIGAVTGMRQESGEFATSSRETSSGSADGTNNEESDTSPDRTSPPATPMPSALSSAPLPSPSNTADLKLESAASSQESSTGSEEEDDVDADEEAEHDSSKQTSAHPATTIVPTSPRLTPTPTPSTAVSELSLKDKEDATKPSSEEKLTEEKLTPTPFQLEVEQTGMNPVQIFDLHRRNLQNIILATKNFSPSQIDSCKQLETALKALSPDQLYQSQELLTDVIKHANIATVDPKDATNLQESQSLITSLNKARYCKMALALTAIIAGAAIVLVSTAIAAASFGVAIGITGIEVGTSMLTKALSIACGLVGMGIFIGGVKTLFSQPVLPHVIEAAREINQTASISALKC